MGVIFLALVAHGSISADADMPFWVKLTCALAIAAGTYLGGWRVIRTLGKGLVEIAAPQGMAAEASSAAIILTSSHLGPSPLHHPCGDGFHHGNRVWDARAPKFVGV